MATLLQDLRYAIRGLSKHPGFTVLAVVTLALGIGASTAIFSIANAHLFASLPYKEPGRLVWIYTNFLKGGAKRAIASAPDFEDWKAQNQSFAEMAVCYGDKYTLTGSGDPLALYGATVSPNLFHLLGVAPVVGHGVHVHENQSGGTPVVLLSHGLWQRRFGGDHSIIGRTLTLNEKSFTISGVMPSNFRFPPNEVYESELWIPKPFGPDNLANRADRSYPVLGRLKQGTSLESARAEMSTIAERLAQSYPVTNRGWGITLLSMHEETVEKTRPVIKLFLAAVGLVLLIACANVTSLLLVRVTARRREIAIRAALGSSRVRLVRQVISESLLLGFAGGVLGLLVSYWSLNFLTALIPTDIPRIQEVKVDGTLFVFALAVSTIAGITAGLVPALAVSRLSVCEILKSGGVTSSSGSDQSRWLDRLVTVEIALSTCLLVGAVLVTESLVRLQAVDPGFQKESVLTANLSLTSNRYADSGQVSRFYQDVLDRLEGMPEIRSAGLALALPVTRRRHETLLTVEGQSYDSNRPQMVRYNVVSGGFFSSMGIPLIAGRSFTSADHETATPVTLVSQAMAKKFWPNEYPIGKRIKFGRPEYDSRLLTVVGIVGDVKQNALTDELRPTFYISYLQVFEPWMRTYLPFKGTLVLRAPLTSRSVADSVRQVVKAVDPNQPIEEFKTLEGVLSDSLQPFRFRTIVLGMLAALALLLAAAGVYGVVSYFVGQRTREIGIRMALGAQRGGIFRLVVGRQMVLTLAGVGVGLVAALALTRVLSSFLFGVTPSDPMRFAIAALLLLLVAMTAAYFPARRATRVDPINALRHE